MKEDEETRAKEGGCVGGLTGWRFTGEAKKTAQINPNKMEKKHTKLARVIDHFIKASELPVRTSL